LWGTIGSLFIAEPANDLGMVISNNSSLKRAAFCLAIGYGVEAMKMQGWI
jgi:hypothetical protein